MTTWSAAELTWFSIFGYIFVGFIWWMIATYCRGRSNALKLFGWEAVPGNEWGFMQGMSIIWFFPLAIGLIVIVVGGPFKVLGALEDVLMRKGVRDQAKVISRQRENGTYIEPKPKPQPRAIEESWIDY